MAKNSLMGEMLKKNSISVSFYCFVFTIVLMLNSFLKFFRKDSFIDLGSTKFYRFCKQTIHRFSPGFFLSETQ